MQKLRTFFNASICAIMVMNFSSCTFLLIGAGVAGGMAISKDTAKLDTDRNFDQAWSASSYVIKKLGVITFEDRKAGIFEANIRDAKVNAIITQITPKSTHIEIKSRKNMLPQIELSNELVMKIQDKLKSSWF